MSNLDKEVQAVEKAVEHELQHGAHEYREEEDADVEKRLRTVLLRIAASEQQRSDAVVEDERLFGFFDLVHKKCPAFPQ